MSVNNLTHVAFILDGNKRWAKKNKLKTILGYQKGFDNIKKIVDCSLDLNISHLTLFTLSSENFKRSSIDVIYEIIYKNFSKILDEFIEQKNVKIKIIGSRINIPHKINDIFNKVETISINNEKLTLNIAFNYGFTDEIKSVVNKIQSTKNKNKLETFNDIKGLFFLGNMPDPDILIRTGGYQRLSNFIMFNLTYTELFFTKTLWPDFDTIEYNKIINKFYNINRKYGL